MQEGGGGGRLRKGQQEGDTGGVLAKAAPVRFESSVMRVGDARGQGCKGQKSRSGGDGGRAEMQRRNHELCAKHLCEASVQSICAKHLREASVRSISFIDGTLSSLRTASRHHPISAP